MLLHYGQQLKCHTTRPLCARFPLLYGAFTRVEVKREHRLTDVIALAKLLDLPWL